jgi:iron(III) transport system ATP-binding protein
MVRLAGIGKKFATARGALPALHPLDLEVAAREFFVLLGSSGSGKTTLLRCVAGIETPDEGEIYLGDRLVFSAARRVNVRPEQRALGMVFQSYAVWPHLTVYQNVALPLVHGTRRIRKQQVRDRVMHALSLVQMADFADRPVPLLSGGQQQRVALARALATEPIVLLMDEPLSNLDARLREEVRVQIKEVTSSVGVTVLYVTHDQAEAAALADRVAVMSEGRLLQVATPDELYRRPSTPAVADFLGRMNWFRGTIQAPDRIESEIGLIEAGTGELSGSVRIALRPADIVISQTASGDVNEFEGLVSNQVFLGEQTHLRLLLQHERSIDVKLFTRTKTPLSGVKVYFRCNPDDVLIFPASTAGQS